MVDMHTYFGYTPNTFLKLPTVENITGVNYQLGQTQTGGNYQLGQGTNWGKERNFLRGCIYYATKYFFPTRQIIYTL